MLLKQQKDHLTESAYEKQMKRLIDLHYLESLGPLYVQSLILNINVKTKSKLLKSAKLQSNFVKPS